ncbi:MAG: 7-carboxy-7-deazaguanine synthase [Bradymonadia bacterium]
MSTINPRRYAIKEAFFTLQGEGGQVGRAAVFCRFTGCNLWSGRTQDRATAPCNFCDTDFVGTDGPGGGRFDAHALAEHLWSIWQSEAGPGGTPYIVFTGGEPTLQLDEALIDCCKARGFELAIETNGTREVPEGIDWVCVSPKPGPALVQLQGQALKLVYPQPEAALQPEMFVDLEFEHFFLQPMDGPQQAENIQAATRYCLKHPQWRLSLQTHKIIGLP